jgi:hypothetical protein
MANFDVFKLGRIFALFWLAEPENSVNSDILNKMHNYTAEQKLLHKRRARNSYDFPLQAINVFIPLLALVAGHTITILLPS